MSMVSAALVEKADELRPLAVRGERPIARDDLRNPLLSEIFIVLLFFLLPCVRSLQIIMLKSRRHAVDFGFGEAMPRGFVAPLGSEQHRSGHPRFFRKEFHPFLSRARGSLAEIETQLLIAQNLGYLSPKRRSPLLAEAAELGRIRNGLIASIQPSQSLQPDTANVDFSEN
jgi:hypothetical protein